MEREKFKRLSRMDVIGIFIYYILLIGFIVGIIYWGYFSGEVSRLGALLLINGKGFFYFFMIFIGLMTFSSIWYKIAVFFYPLTKTEIKNKKKKRKQFREARIKYYEKKIKKLKDKKW